MRESVTALQPWRSRSRLSSGVLCPHCHESALSGRFSCLATQFSCSSCHTTYDLSELHHLLGGAEFEALAALVQDQLSDRV